MKWVLLGVVLLVVFIVLEGKRQEKKYGRARGGSLMRAGLLDFQRHLEPERKVEILVGGRERTFAVESGDEPNKVATDDSRSGGDMSTKNAALARRWFEEVWNERRDATVEELMHSEAVGHMEGLEIRGPSEFLSARATLLQAFPDLRVEVDGIVAEGDDVVVRWSAKGTHRGEGLGSAASRKSAEFRGMSWLHFREGRIVEGWDAWNQGRLLQDLQAP
jgi:steroid delta-isomerase-like uncharacterized protein